MWRCEGQCPTSRPLVDTAKEAFVNTKTDTQISEIETRSTGVLVIGAGAAGLRAAIELHQRHVPVLVLGKRARDDAHTVLAAGGINAALATMDPDDTPLIHAADTLREGRMLGDPRAVEILCREAPRAIEELVDWGADFARGSDGRLLQRYFGAHRYRRTCFSGDVTGKEVLFTLLHEADRRGIEIMGGVYITGLLRDADGICGAAGIRIEDGRPILFTARAVLMAAGGHIRVYQRSTSRPGENTGDGMGLALRAGAELMDMELVQFHPTGMVSPPDLEGTLVTEAVRGEGGILTNAGGERFMRRYDPDRLELSTRDRVALAIATEIREGRGTPRNAVYLSLAYVAPETIAERLPRMLAQFREVGIDITRESMEVAPTAHYSMGGVRVSPESHATTIPGLFAAGEVSAGVHGANRLGGNSLVECVVFGRIAATAAADWSRGRGAPILDAEHVAAALRPLAEGSADPAAAPALAAELRALMWAKAGLLRDGPTLREAIAGIDSLYDRSDGLGGGGLRGHALAAALDLPSLLLTARATVLSALARTESRGAHQRTDYPETDPAWLRNIICRIEGGELHLSSEPVPAPSPDLAATLDDADRVPVMHHGLE